ncbi:LuxR C-terminal-related transcriptional regulator [Streptomyces sp. NPDC001553]|uniref:LuxR C-terminal-related transcriptional regulator n=1 Tax=Streptomyces sp. NPDC001553 TaxID=3154385 RepID=UPI003317ECCF
MPTTAAIIALTQAQKRVARHLVHGATTDTIADREHLSRGTVKNHLSHVRESLNCPVLSTRAVLVNALLTHRQVPPPRAPRPEIELTSAEQRLLHAYAEHSRAPDIALAAALAPGDLRAGTDALMAKTGATDPTHLVGIGHALGLLGPAIHETSAQGGAPEEVGR